MDHFTTPHLFSICLTAVCFMGCGTKLYKPEAVNLSFFEESEAYREMLLGEDLANVAIEPGISWFADARPQEQLVFLAYKESPSEEPVYGLLLEIDTDKEELVVWPLEAEKDPLGILQDTESREYYERLTQSYSQDEFSDDRVPIRLQFSDLLERQLLAPPLPQPTHIFAAAANYPSHLRHDLGIRDIVRRQELLQKARPRVFLKYPPTPPPIASMSFDEEQYASFAELLGPFDTVLFPDSVTIPAADEGSSLTEARLDYEVEVGVVIGKDLSWQEVREATVKELESAIAGYVLLGETKFRNPQAMNAIMHYGGLPDEKNPYRIGDPELDARLGIWDERTCAWWSYAASWGRFTSLGPYFVAASAKSRNSDRMLLSARSYGGKDQRKYDAPKEVEIGKLYIRQASRRSGLRGETPIWGVPQLIRSILEPGGVLAVQGEPPVIKRGDIIALGTPGGTVLTAKPSVLINALRKVLFWWNDLDWHDAFFGRSREEYLYEGDEVFYWAEGLGFQQLYFKALLPPVEEEDTFSQLSSSKQGSEIAKTKP